LLARYGVGGPDDIILIATGKIERPSDACLCCGSHNTTRQFFGDLVAEDRIVVADLEAGLNDLMWAHPGPDDIVLAVSDGSAKSVEIARRSCRLSEEMGVRRVIGVANRMAGWAQSQRLTTELGIAEAVPIPEDPAVLEADRLGVAAFDAFPDSPALAAVGRLARRLGRS
jgi:CO dehydrogenase maturation factor